MISVFLREQERYSREYLEQAFQSGSDTANIIKKLKSYGILKTVKGTKEQKDLSDLADEDIAYIDEEDMTTQRWYVFTFVGVIIVDGRVLKCYPKYIRSKDEPAEELKEVLRVLRKYNSKHQIIQIYSEVGNSSSFNRLGAIIWLLEDYFEHGIYSNREQIVETNGAGEILWVRTVDYTHPIIKDGRPYYTELKTRRRVKNDHYFIKILHECILTECSEVLQETGLSYLLDMPEVDLTDTKRNELGDNEYLLYRIGNELNIQFNTRKQQVLETIEAYIAEHGTLTDAGNINMFGTNSYELVWQDVCQDVMDNKLHITIPNLLKALNIAPNDDDKDSSETLMSMIEKPFYTGFSDDESSFDVPAKKTLEPDLISIDRNGKQIDFIIFDAKYCNIRIEQPNVLAGNPGVGDVTKQYLYQLAYRKFLNKYGISDIRNCFLMPTEKDSVQKTGFAHMGMLESLELEPIQIRQLPAKRMYAYYLAMKKMKLKDLELDASVFSNPELMESSEDMFIQKGTDMTSATSSGDVIHSIFQSNKIAANERILRIAQMIYEAGYKKGKEEKDGT